ncbi:hypothetical protein [Lentzea sp. NEAU-D7]|uniref:hypothetical protein n=1 Tax=Lentzea sp. NEAU-D7 TaxID=2994667 RepID=UPI00224ADBC3|nr:hypothetical protein [Lentzea sp. NEAU-D7]MCX2950744.1 hypothetical protein [Lentzea sp. NEAU-D7]
MVEHLPGAPTLLAAIGDSQIAVQTPDGPDGLKLAAQFAWGLAKAATEFAARCEELHLAASNAESETFAPVSEDELARWSTLVGRAE